jgi:hypothetical protein
MQLPQVGLLVGPVVPDSIDITLTTMDSTVWIGRLGEEKFDGEDASRVRRHRRADDRTAPPEGIVADQAAGEGIRRSFLQLLISMKQHYLRDSRLRHSIICRQSES